MEKLGLRKDLTKDICKMAVKFFWMDEMLTDSIFRRSDRTHCPSESCMTHADFVT